MPVQCSQELGVHHFVFRHEAPILRQWPMPPHLYRCSVQQPVQRLLTTAVQRLDRPYPARQVYVTGTFDNWAQSVKLDLTDNGFSKEVELPEDQAIHYKVCDSAAPFPAFAANLLRSLLFNSHFKPLSPTLCVRWHMTMPVEDRPAMGAFRRTSSASSKQKLAFSSGTVGVLVGHLRLQGRRWQKFAVRLERPIAPCVWWVRASTSRALSSWRKPKYLEVLHQWRDWFTTTSSFAISAASDADVYLQRQAASFFAFPPPSFSNAFISFISRQLPDLSLFAILHQFASKFFTFTPATLPPQPLCFTSFGNSSA